MQTVYFEIAIVALAVILGIIILRSRQKTIQPRKPSDRARVGMLMVVLAIVIGENRWVGYSLMGLGVLLAVVDLFKNPK